MNSHCIHKHLKPMRKPMDCLLL